MIESRKDPNMVAANDVVFSKECLDCKTTYFGLVQKCGCGGSIVKAVDKSAMAKLQLKFRERYRPSDAQKSREVEKHDNSKTLFTEYCQKDEFSQLQVTKTTFSAISATAVTGHEVPLSDQEVIIREMGKPIMVNPNNDSAFAVILEE